MSPADNGRLSALFDADQQDRRAASGGAIDWTKLSLADDTRRAEVHAMLAAGMVRSGADYYHAAFVFQHGDEPRDYLLAHTLAVTAIAKGRSDAGWIAAATLDRYLGPSVSRRSMARNTGPSGAIRPRRSRMTAHCWVTSKGAP